MDMMNTPNDERTQADSKRFFQDAIELALSIGDCQKETHSEYTPEAIVSEAIGRISRLIRFEASAIYLVDEETSDLKLSVCSPYNTSNSMEKELAFMIQNGFVAWAIRERRGITVYSKDGSHQVLLHVLATYSRIRGLYIGFFPPESARIPDASLEIVSLILRNAVNSMESLIYSTMLQQQKQDLEKEVAQKTRQLLRYEKQLVQAQNTEAIAALAGGVAHQFNNALTGLAGNMDLISMTLPGDSEILPYIERIRPIVERMSNLTAQLLAYAQGGTYLTKGISLPAMFNEFLPTIKHALKNTVHLSVELSDEAITVDVDVIQMRTAILAIINNANEAIVDEGSIRIWIQCFRWDQLPDDISSELKPGDYACIHVQDNGTGMDSNTVRRLFEPFFSTKFEGRGLSMAVVSNIIKSHNGWITVSSKRGKGTKVQIYLPMMTVS